MPESKIDWLNDNIDIENLYTRLTGMEVRHGRADSPGGSLKAVSFMPSPNGRQHFFDFAAGVGGDVIALWQYCRRGEDPEDTERRKAAIRDMYEAYGGFGAVPVSGPARKTPAKPEAGTLDPRTLDRAYRVLLGCCALTPESRIYLRGRGLTDTEIDSVGFRTYPDTSVCPTLTQKLKEAGIDPDSVPGLYTPNGTDICSFAARNGVLIPVRTTAGLIAGLQIRDSDPRAEVRYRWMSTPTDLRGVKHAGKSSGSPTGAFHGCPGFRSLLITEGVFKALAFNRAFRAPVLAVQGVGNIKSVPGELREMLNRYPIQRVLIGYDADFDGNMNVAGNAVKLYEAIRGIAPAAEVNYLAWPRNLGKGIDDALEKGTKVFADSAVQIPMDRFKKVFEEFLPVAAAMRAENSDRETIGIHFRQRLQS